MPIDTSIRSLPLCPTIHEAKFSGREFTREQIQNVIEQLTSRYTDKNFQVLLPYESWRSGSWFKKGDPISLFSLNDYYDESQMPDDNDPGTYSEFLVYISDPLPQAGGYDNQHNDCLYRCLYLAYGTRSRLPQNIKTPELLKEKLGLTRDDPIPVSFINRVEELAGTIAINVSGDYIYQSNRKCKRIINLILSNGHYSMAKNLNRKKLKAWYKESKKPLVYEKHEIENTVKYYDGNTYWTSSVAELRKLKSKRWSGKWCFIKINKPYSFSETLYQFNAEQNALLEKTQKIGLPIDLNKCCGSYKIAALWLFEKLSYGVPANEPLDPIEAQWISNAIKGGLIWAENDWQGYGRQYDFTSLYPYLLTKHFYPICKGRFDTVKSIYYNNRGKRFIYYGIYAAKVEYKKEMAALFRYNSKDMYTHHDLSRAYDLGLTVILNKTAPNALIYDSKKNYPGSVMFGSYVEMLFNIKTEGGPASTAAKKILNILWGALCEKMLMCYEIGKDTRWTIDTPFNVPESEIVSTIIPLGKDNWTVHCSRPDNMFKGEYPRIAPFLLAAGRNLISKTIEPYKYCLKRVHTDGFVLKEISAQDRLITVSENANTILGDLKFEKEGMCHVKNANQVIWP